MGFENLYILDGSNDPRCISFLVFARDNLGVNVIFTPANLNQLAGELSLVGRGVAGSADVIMKMDADEYLAFYEDDQKCRDPGAIVNASCPLSPYAASSFLRNHKNHLATIGKDLAPKIGALSMGYSSFSVPDRETCENQKGDKSIGLMKFGGVSHFPGGTVKTVMDARLLTKIDLGGHEPYYQKPFNNNLTKIKTPVGILHTHFRCLATEVANCAKAMVSHGYLNAADSPKQHLQDLLKKFPVGENPCDPKATPKNVQSSHKFMFYVQYLAKCPKYEPHVYYSKERGYYGRGLKGDGDAGNRNSDFQQFLEASTSKYQVPQVGSN